MIKNKFILKSISLFLSFWMLLASTGFSVNYHYCEGEIVNWSILDNADECEHEIEVKPCCEIENATKCHNPSDVTVKKSDCCNSDQASVVLESEFNLTSSEVEFTVPQLIILSQFLFSVSTSENKQIEYVNYEVPLLEYRQEAPFIQSFLI